jgi:hypothetical protein
VDAYLADSAKETSPFPLLTPVQTDTKNADLLVQAQDNGCIADLVVQFVINKVPVALKIVIPASTDGQFEVRDIIPVASKDQVDLLVTGTGAIGTVFISASMILS